MQETTEAPTIEVPTEPEPYIYLSNVLMEDLGQASEWIETDFQLPVLGSSAMRDTVVSVSFLDTLDMSSFDTSNVAEMAEMFVNCLGELVPALTASSMYKNTSCGENFLRRCFLCAKQNIWASL